MPVISVMYPSDGGESFDEQYYLQTHMPLVREKWGPLGLSDTKVMRGVPGPDGSAPAFMMTALLTFGSIEQFHGAVAQHGPEVFGDVANFTAAKPMVQFNESLD
ncbi:MAG: EthD family reductase [Pseudomonadota bacterium]|nr:EthD family reductase [Pseudomonadota bacterium]